MQSVVRLLVLFPVLLLVLALMAGCKSSTESGKESAGKEDPPEADKEEPAGEPDSSEPEGDNGGDSAGALDPEATDASGDTAPTAATSPPGDAAAPAAEGDLVGVEGHCTLPEGIKPVAPVRWPGMLLGPFMTDAPVTELLGGIQGIADSEHVFNPNGAVDASSCIERAAATEVSDGISPFDQVTLVVCDGEREAGTFPSYVFAVLRVQGTSGHYVLPLFGWTQYDSMRGVDDPETGEMVMVGVQSQRTANLTKAEGVVVGEEHMLRLDMAGLLVEEENDEEAEPRNLEQPLKWVAFVSLREGVPVIRFVADADCWGTDNWEVAAGGDLGTEILVTVNTEEMPFDVASRDVHLTPWPVPLPTTE